MNRKLTVKRLIVYLAGMVILAFGLTLNTKTSLGASAILSLPFTISEVFGLNFGNMTLVFYVAMVVVQLFLVKGNVLKILLQIPLSLVFTRFINLFKAVIPYQSSQLALNILVALIAICLTALGIVMTVNTDLIPNPGDGFVNSISVKSGKELGRVKNIVDLSFVAVSLAVGAAKGKPLAGVGIGTVLSMILVGIVVSFFNKRFRERIRSL